MSTFRGFTVGLITRVERAGNHHLDRNTLKFFNAYGGTHAPISDDAVAVVESVKFDDEPRVYRVMLFRFFPAAKHAETHERCESAAITTNGTKYAAEKALTDFARVARAKGVAYWSENDRWLSRQENYKGF